MRVTGQSEVLRNHEAGACQGAHLHHPGWLQFEGPHARRFCQFLPAAPSPRPTQPLFSSPTQIKGTKTQTCKHRPHTVAHEQARAAHALSCIHSPTQALVVSTDYKLANMPACTRTRGQTPTCTGTAQNNPRQGLPSTCLAANQTNQLGLA